jgi:hypothetical protein
MKSNKKISDSLKFILKLCYRRNPFYNLTNLN